MATNVKFAAIHLAASSDRFRAFPPSEAIRFRSAADKRLARARPPLLPNALAISERFIISLYLSLSILHTRLESKDNGLSY